LNNILSEQKYENNIKVIGVMKSNLVFVFLLSAVLVSSGCISNGEDTSEDVFESYAAAESQEEADELRHPDSPLTGVETVSENLEISNKEVDQKSSQEFIEEFVEDESMAEVLLEDLESEKVELEDSQDFEEVEVVYYNVELESGDSEEGGFLMVKDEEWYVWIDIAI